MHKINFIPPLVFKTLKIKQPPWACLGMPDHAHLKSHHQSVVLIDMYLHAKNQLYTSNSV